MFHRRYRENQFKIELSKDGSRYFVWCETGAAQAIANDTHVTYLAAHLDNAFLIHYANGAFHDIERGSPYAKELDRIAETYDVSLYGLNLPGGYVAWQRLRANPRNGTDAVRIMRKPDDMVELLWNGRNKEVTGIATDMDDDALNALLEDLAARARDRGVEPGDVRSSWTTHLPIAIRRWNDTAAVHFDAQMLDHDHRDASLLTVVNTVLERGTNAYARLPLYG